MGRVSRKWFLPAGGLVLLLALFAWIYGWGGGPVNLLDFPAEDVARVRLSDPLHAVELTETEDIRALLDAVNAFRRSGNQLKDHPGLLFGLALGGTKLYTFEVFLKNGEAFTACFGLNKAGQPAEDTEVGYWVPGRPSGPFGNTCRGSMELIYEWMDQAPLVESPSW